MTHSTSTPASRRARSRLMTGGAVGLAISALMLAPQARAQTAPPPGQAFQGTAQVVVPGSATVVQTATQDTITVRDPQAIINWTPNDRTGTGTIDFLPVGRSARFTGAQEFTVLNRIIPLDGNDVPIARMIALNGTITSDINGQQPGGNVWFYSPGGILVGGRSLINVGSLLLTSRDIDTTGGLFGPGGEIRFRNPSIAGAAGQVQIAPDAFILANSTVAGSAYVAVVAPSIVQAGTIRADGSVALVAAEQVDIRINQGLFDINVLVGTDHPHGIVHTGTTGGPSDTSGTYESRAYLVAVPKNQAITMLLSGTIGFETASSVSIDANGGIVLSAGHNVAGGVIAGRVPGNLGPAGISITDSSFRNNLDATATGTINGRPNQSCQPFCDNSPSGQLLFNGNATLNGAGGVSLSIGQAQQIIVNGNLSLRSATASSGTGGSASLTIDNVSPPSSSSGQGIASITGALLIDASGRGNPATESGTATGGAAALSVNNGFLNAASISILADAQGALGGSTTGGSGTGGTASLTVENGGSVSTNGLLRISADGRGGGIGIDAQQNPVLPAIGGTGRGGNATLTIDNGLVSANATEVAASGFGAAGTATSGDGFGGTADVSVDNNGGTTALTGGSLLVAARGQGGGSGFDPVSFQSISTADGGNGTGGTASVTLTDTTPRDINLGFVVIDAGADGGNALSSSQSPAPATGGDATGGTASFRMNGTTSNAAIEQLTVASVANGGNGVGILGRGGNATGGTSTMSLDSGAGLVNSISQSTVGGTRLNADGFGGIGQDRSGNGVGGTANAVVAAGAQIDTDIIFLTASGVGGGGELVQQSFTPVTTIGGNGSGGTVTLTSGGTINSATIQLDANGFGGTSNPASNAVSVSTGGSAVGGSARFNLTGGAITVGDAAIRANATAGGSATQVGTSGASLGGSSLLFQTGGTFAITGNLAVEARGYVFDGFGNQLAQTGGSAGVAVSAGTIDVDGTIRLDASAGSNNGTLDGTQSLAITGGSTSFDATDNAVVTTGGLLLLSSASGPLGFGDENSGLGAPATGGTGKLRSASGALITVENEFRIDASGTGGFAARGGMGTGGTIEVDLDGGALTLAGPAQLNASGVSGFSFGTAGSTSARGGSVTVTIGSADGSAIKFNSLAIAATADSGQPFSPAARGGPVPVVASDATGGSVTMLIDGGSVTGNQLTVSADGYGSNGGSGTGGSASFTQTGGTAQFVGVSLTADGYGGTSPPALETGSGPVVGGLGRGGTTTVSLTGGTISTSFFGASASGFGGSGFSAFNDNANGEGGLLLLPGDGGDGIGGSVDVLIDDTASAGLGTAFFSAFGRGGNGGNSTTGGEEPVFTPGRGGRATGGNVFVDLAGGETSGAIFASASAVGGDGGRIFNFGGTNEQIDFAGSGSDPEPVGGDATGGSAEIRLATTVSASLSADATASAGEGGMALSGARGGNASGGLARIIVDDGVDAGSIDVSLSAAGFGGRGGRAIHGDGGDGGNGTGGTTAFDIANGGIADVLNSNVDARGVGGEGRQGTINPNFAAIPGSHNGGDGGDGTGGTIAIGVIDADLALSAGNGEGIILQSFGFGGFGGDGASGGSVTTLGGNGGDGGGGTINLSAAGGTLTTTDGAAIQITVGGEGGEGGFGSSGAQGLTGQLRGGLARIEAHDTESGAGLVDLALLSIVADGDFGGRVELIDDTAGPGISFDSLSISAAGTPVDSSDFALSGSGIYVSSRAGTITVDGAGFFNLTGDFRVDAFDSGGFNFAGDLGVTARTITANHSARGTGSTITGQRLTFNANSIALQPGTLVTASNGDLTLSAATGIIFGALSAPFGNIFLFAGGDILGDDAVAGGGIEAESDDDIDVGNLTALGIVGGQTSSAPTSGIVRLRADDRIDFGTISASNGVELDAGTNIAGEDIDSGGYIFAASAEGNIDIDTSTASGNIAFTAAEGDVRGDFADSEFGSIVIRAVNVDFGELYANSVIDILAEDDVDLDFAQTGGEGCGTFGCGEGGQFDLAKPLKLTPTGSDILIEAGGTVTLGTLDAADNIVIDAGGLAGATSSLTAGQRLTATIDGNAEFGSLLSGGNMALTAGGTATGQSAETTGSGTSLSLSATNGLTMGSIRASGTANLAASAGAVTVANLRAVGLVDASGRSVTVSGGTGLVDFASLRATAGDARVTLGSGDLIVRSGTATGTLALTTQNGAIETRGLQGGTVTIDSSRGATLNNATTATGALGVTARNTATINGVASGGTVRITSGDIVLASTGRVGTAGTTTEVLLINGDGNRRTFVGGTGTTAGYSLSADEMTRLFGNNITIRAPRVSLNEGTVASAPGTSVIAPSNDPDLVIDAFSINGGGGTGNLGSSGILRIETPGFARVIGAAQVANAASGNSFVVAADRSLQVILGSGSLRIGNGTALTGALRLISEDVVVATADAIADIAVAPDMAAIDERLAQNDGVISDEGALSGGTIRFEVGRGLYIQNSGNGDGFDDRRGFTAGTGGVSIFTGESSSTSGGGTARLVINGRTTSEAGEILTGIDAFTRISVNQTLLTGDSQVVNGIDAGSTINGCLIASASNCFEFEIDLIPPIQDNPLVNFDDEESELTGGGDPLDVATIVEIEDRDRMSNEPIIDEPVTGSGNDDLWSPTEREEDEEED